MKGILQERRLREEDETDGDQVVLGDGEVGHHSLGSKLAKQGTIGDELQLEEKPPCWDYMREEENSLQLILQEEE